MRFLHIVRHLFVPHHTNNHRAKILHVDALFFYIFAFALLQPGLKTLQHTFPDVLGYATDIRVEQLLAGTNQKRTESGFSPLTLNEKLSAAAASKAVDMFANNYWAHNAPSGKTPWEFIAASGYRYTVAGENLAKNFSTSTNVVDAWMASPSHRDNILESNYQEVGFAVVNGILAGEETTLVVQMFGAASAPVSVVTQVNAVEVPKLAAQTTSPTPAPTKTMIPIAATESTIALQIPEVAIAPSAYAAAVTKRPIINIPTLTREVVYIFLAVFMMVTVLDAWLVAHRRIVRIGGHSVAHLLFFIAIAAASFFVHRGSLI